MKLFINTIVFIAFIMQFIAFFLGVTSLKKAENTLTLILHEFHFVAYICSLLVAIIFFVVYNYRMNEKKSLNSILLIIALFAIYIYTSQIFVLNDFIATSLILLTTDIYIILKSLKRIMGTGF